ncbi:MAG: DUF3575 domain-containing protein [Lewinellaceae bacterium]|nr:DUF3575 domain-containing protein [Lewinellaceae bacterium]
MTRTLALAIPAFLLFIFLSNTSSAQSRRSSYKSSEPEKRFVVGLAPFSLLFPSGKVNLHGEWAYADNKSLSVEEGATVTNKFNSFGITAENRFYLAKNAPRGFYLAPYVRYNRLWIDRITENPEERGETTITGALGGFGLGGSLGWQFRLGEHMTLDATFAGVDFKLMRGTLIYKTTDPENDIAAFRDKVQETVGDIPIIGSKLVAAIEGDQVKVHSPRILLPAYRFNVTVNYAF